MESYAGARDCTGTHECVFCFLATCNQRDLLGGKPIMMLFDEKGKRVVVGADIGRHAEFPPVVNNSGVIFCACMTLKARPKYVFPAALMTEHQRQAG